MTRHWRGILTAGVVGAMAVVAVWAAPVSLLNIAAGTDGDGRPLVSLNADRPIEFESFVLDGPDRLVIDLPGTVNRVQQSRMAVNMGGVARVRAAQHTTQPVAVTRVVFDLEAALAYRIEQEGSAILVTFGEGDGFARGPVRQSDDPATWEVEVAAGTASPQTVDDLLREMERREAGLSADADRGEIEVPEVLVAELADPLADEVVEPDGSVFIGGNAGPVADETRAIDADVIDRLLATPKMAAPQEAVYGDMPASFQSRTILTDEVSYTGRRISLNLVDADIKQVFRLFHEISSLNFVLDPGVSGRVTIVLDQVPWDQALDIILKNNGLDKVLENNVLRIASTQKLAQEAASRRQLRDAQELEVEPVTLTRTLSYARATDVERVIQNGGILSPRGSVIVDERTNTLIISDVPKKVSPIDTLIDTLDSETPQVMIEARIVETSRQYVRDLGVSWGFQASASAATGTGTGLSFPANATVGYGLNLPGGGGASQLAFGLGNVIDSFTLDLALNALEQEGHGRILSSPKIATQNNERAEIEQGVRIPIVNTTATEINVEFVSASLRLIVTPQITAEGTIVLDVEVENNSPDFVNTSGDVPSIRTQRANTKVLISDGGTTVIGGIFTVNEGKSEQGVPWFRKIPGLGWLFKTQNITVENRELLIFITPKIVKLS